MSQSSDFEKANIKTTEPIKNINDSNDSNNTTSIESIQDSKFNKPNKYIKVQGENSLKTNKQNKQKRTNVGEVVARKTFSKAQLKISQPLQEREYIFKSDKVVDKKKYEKFSNTKQTNAKSKITDDIKDDIQEKSDRSVKRVKIGFFSKAVQKENTLGEVIDF
jgi:hypothetical protein